MKKPKKIIKFVSGYSNGAQNNVRVALKRFSTFLKKDLENYLIDDFELLTIQSPTKAYKYRKLVEHDIKAWVKSMLDSGTMKESTIECYYKNIKQLFLKNDIILKESCHSEIKKMINVKVHVANDKALTFDEFENVLRFCKDIKSRAFFSMAVVSGMRPIELLKCRLEHINFDSNPTMITIPAANSKTRTERITFLTPEVTNILKDWLEVREDEFKKSIKRRYKFKSQKKKSEGVKIPSYDLDFVFGGIVKMTFYKSWVSLLKLSGFDEKIEGRFVYHFYTLRKTFATTFGGSTWDNMDFKTQALLGHKIGVTSHHYIRFSEDELRQAYIEKMDRLVIFGPKTSQEQADIIEKQTQLMKEVEQKHKAEMMKMQDKFNAKIEMLQSEWQRHYYKPEVIDSYDVDGEHVVIEHKASDDELVKRWNQIKKHRDNIKKLGKEKYLKLLDLERQQLKLLSG